MSTWVCTKHNLSPTDEEKWRVLDTQKHEYVVHAKDEGVPLGKHIVPKSDYRVCEPPERWVDVTSECETSSIDKGYRMRKVQLRDNSINEIHGKLQWAFIVEKREDV